MQQNSNGAPAQDGCISLSILTAIILAVGIVVRGASGSQMLELCSGTFVALVLLIYARLSKGTFAYIILLAIGLPLALWVTYFVATDNYETYQEFGKRFQIFSTDDDKSKDKATEPAPAPTEETSNSVVPPVQTSSGEPEQTETPASPKSQIPDNPYKPILDRLGSFAADLEEAKTSITDDFEMWRLYLGIILAIQYAVSLYVSKNLGLMKSPLLTLLIVLIGMLSLFTDMTEWMYEGIVVPLLDAGPGGKVLVVGLAALTGTTGTGNIAAFIMAILFYDNQVMTLCLLPSIVIAAPILIIRLRKAMTIKVPPVSKTTYQSQWAVIITGIVIAWYLIYMAIQDPKVEDFGKFAEAPEPTATLLVTPAATEEVSLGPTTEAPPRLETHLEIPGLVAFDSSSSGNRNVYIFNGVTGELQLLLDDNSENYNPDWSPDGTRLVFVSNRAGVGDIFSASADGTDIQQLTHNDTGQDYNPVWSPDGKQILFVSERDNNQNLYIMNANGSNERRLTDHNADDYDPAWSPDGTKIVFVSKRDGNGDIYVMDGNGANVERLTFNDTGGDYDPAWSADAASILFVSLRDGNQKIYIMNAAGKNQRRLSALGGDDHDPVWVSDGTSILFAADREGQSQLYLLNPESGAEELIVTLEAPTVDLSWYGAPQGDD